MSRKQKYKQRRRSYSKQQSNNTAVLELQQDDQPVNILEMSKRMKAKTFGPKRKGLDMTWDDTSLGAGSVQTREGLLDERDRKDTYYKCYIANQWVSGCVDVIAKRITSGGWKCVETEDGKGSPENEALIKNLLKLENLEEDFVQLVCSIATDMLIFGEAYCELVYDGSGNLISLCMIDCVTMTTFFDRHGNVTGYKQTLEKSLDSVYFEPDEIIRWWFPDPRAKKKALSPIEKLKDPVYLQQAMDTWQEKFFRQGGKPAYSIEMGPDSNEDDADRWLTWYRENYLGIQNAHVPPAMYGGGKIVEFGKGPIDIDFDKGEDKQRLKILVVYGVPPGQLSIIESGNLGGGTGEDQNKAFVNNTVTPLANVILEKFNYRVFEKAMGIMDWKVTTQYADYRNDTTVTDIEDKQIRNGSMKINEVRQEHGREPLDGGDEAVIVTSKEVTPVQRFDDLADEQQQSSQLDIETKKAQVDKLKNPPPPPPQLVVGQHPADQQNGKQPPTPLQGGQQPPALQKGNQQDAKEMLDQWRNEYIQESSHTGVMVAFFLKPSEACQLALPNGEPIDDLHCTLAFLGDKSELGDADKLKQAVSDFAKSATSLQGETSGIGRFSPSDSSDGLSPIISLVNVSGLQDFRRSLVDVLDHAGFQVAHDFDYSPHITLLYANPYQTMPVDYMENVPLQFDTIWLAIGDDRYAFPLDKTEEHRLGDEEERWVIEELIKRYRLEDKIRVKQQSIAPRRESQGTETPQLESPCESTRPTPSRTQTSRETPRTQETSYSSEASRTSSTSSSQEEIIHWQENDPSIQKQLAELKAKGIKTIGPWECHPGACADCLQNQGQTVDLGQKFKSGCYMSPNHGHCECTHKENV